MRSLSPVVPGFWRVDLGVVNAYISSWQDQWVLIDTGNSGDHTDILRALRQLDVDPEDLSAIIVTHHHPDHAGGLAALIEATGAEAWMHPADAAEVRVGNGTRDVILTSGLLNWTLNRLFIRPKPERYEPAGVAHEVDDGDTLPGGFVAVHTPGHSAGHLALWSEEHRLLVVGDACTHLPVLTHSVVYEDPALGRESLRRLAEFDTETAVFGHGSPIASGAGDALSKAFG